MAIDKVVDSAQLDAAMTATANAIRTQGGTSAQIEWKQTTGFAEAIAAISTSSLEIVVTVTSGATVTATKGSQSVSGTSVNGTCTLTVPEAGTWSVSAALNGQTSTTKQVAVGDSYAVTLTFVSSVLDDNEWSIIRAVSDAGQASNYWSVGDCKAVTLNGTVGHLTLENYICYAFILGFDHNAALEGTNRIHFQFGKTARTDGTIITFVDSNYGSKVSETGWFSMNATGTNVGGWASSQMRTNICGTSLTSYDGTFIGVIPAQLRAVLKPATKYTDNVGNCSTAESAVTATMDYIFLMSEYEVYGSGSDRVNEAEIERQEQYAFYAAGNDQDPKRHDGADDDLIFYFLRSPAKDWDSQFVFHFSSWSASSVATNSYGFSPCFCV